MCSAPLGSARYCAVLAGATGLEKFANKPQSQLRLSVQYDRPTSLVRSSASYRDRQQKVTISWQEHPTQFASRTTNQQRYSNL